MDFTWWLISYPIPNIFQGNHIVSCQSSYEHDPNGAGVICKKEFSAWKIVNTYPKICKVTKLYIADRRPATTLNTLPGSFLCFCIIFLVFVSFGYLSLLVPGWQDLAGFRRGQTWP